MDFIGIEKKWQKIWEERGLYDFNPENLDKKYYVLEMFSYPSAANLHVGHWYNYGPSDTFARFKRMQGFNVFHPMGFDAFGLPAENYAIKTGKHPETSTLANIEYMEKQLKAIGASYDWNYEVVTCLPDYYRWTQWLFLQLYHKGLAYRKEAPVNWCPNCNTVLANEQVIDGECERCGGTVVRKNLVQWFFKITEYAEELLAGLPNLDWPEKTKAMQKNWIGKSEGGEVKFSLVSPTASGTPPYPKGELSALKVFTTRADTLFGVTYVVLAPEHPLVDKITTAEQKEAVKTYREEVAKATEIERLATDRKKTGVFTGSYAINPVNGEKVPVYICDYVLASYGTGAVMGVPAHDDRDFIFAKTYNLPIRHVISPTASGTPPYAKGVIENPNSLRIREYPAGGRDGDGVVCFTDDGVLINSGEFSGLSSKDARDAILEKLAAAEKGGKRINYRLRDWLVSRQRYWGCPIPIVHCPHCGEVPVPEEQLPIVLPKDVDFTPDGKSPLLKSESFMNTTCPICGAPAKRDADTLDTFVCSSWYYLRYPNAKNGKEAFNKELTNAIMPVDKYIGGAEHAVMHLLYARFFTKALRDLGYLNFDEPFKSLVHQGTILGEDGQKMSKSRGNVINPNEYVEKYGADCFRLYLMFGFNYTDGGPWSASGIESIARFLERVESIVRSSCMSPCGDYCLDKERAKELNFVRHNAIKNIGRDLERFSFNTAVARLMEYVNALQKYPNDLFKGECVKDLLLLLAPFAPHVAEELFSVFARGEQSVHTQKFPEFDENALVLNEYELAVQINSKNRGKITVSANATNEDIEKAARENQTIAPQLDGLQVVKVIIIPKRLVNFVVK